LVSTSRRENYGYYQHGTTSHARATLRHVGNPPANNSFVIITQLLICNEFRNSPEVDYVLIGGAVVFQGYKRSQRILIFGMIQP
jgi:hypothetical protein